MAKSSQAWTNYKTKPGNLRKLRARQACIEAIRKGELARQSCEKCGATSAEAHHDDYSKPFDVKWLCRKHHAELHRGPRGPNGTHCRRGQHELTGDNLMTNIENGCEKRRCRACKIQADKIRHRKV